MQNLHTELLSELAHWHSDARLHGGAPRSAADTVHTAPRRRRSTGRLRPRHRFPRSDP